MFNSKLIAEVLTKRGLDKTAIEIPEDDFDYTFINTENAKDRFIHNIIHANKKVGVLIDVDVDGLASGKIIVDYVKKLGARCIYMVNKGKVHGLNGDVINWVKDNKIEYLIVVDAGTKDKKYFKELNELGVDVLVLDHHEAEVEDLINTGNTIVVNCSYEGSKNPYLSGAGVVYKFIKDVNEYININIDNYKTWVGLSVISDSCNVLNPENRYYINYLYTYYKDDPLLCKFENYGSLENMFKFNVIPLLNSCFRMDEGDLALALVFCDNDKKIDELLDQAKVVYRKQRALVEEAFIDMKVLEGKSIVISRVDDKYKNLTGLIAAKLANSYGKASIVIWEDTQHYVGSFRGRGKFTKNELIGVTCKGHLKASGVFINKEDFVGVVRNILNLDVMVQDTELYDIEILEDDFTLLYRDLYKLAYLNEYSGEGFEKIYIKIKGIKNNADVIRYQNVIKYRYRFFEVVEFNMEVDEVKDSKEKEIVVYPVINKSGFTLVK